MQPGDIVRTEADIADTTRLLGYAPTTPVEVGVRRFADWYCEYHGVTRG